MYVCIEEKLHQTKIIETKHITKIYPNDLNDKIQAF